MYAPWVLTWKRKNIFGVLSGGDRMMNFRATGETFLEGVIKPAAKPELAASPVPVIMVQSLPPVSG